MDGFGIRRNHQLLISVEGVRASRPIIESIFICNARLLAPPLVCCIHRLNPPQRTIIRLRMAA